MSGHGDVQGQRRPCSRCGRGTVFLGTVWVHAGSNNRACSPTDLRLIAMLSHDTGRREHA